MYIKIWKRCANVLKTFFIILLFYTYFIYMFIHVERRKDFSSFNCFDKIKRKFSDNMIW